MVNTIVLHSVGDFIPESIHNRGLRCRWAGTGASVGAGATSSDDVDATPSDSFHTGILSPSSTLGSPIDDGCGPELEPRPVCEGEEPQASHLPGPSPPQVMPWACPCWP